MLSLVTVSPVITAFHSCCLSHHVSRWALSEDSSFKSYPSRPEVYLVTLRLYSRNGCERVFVVCERWVGDGTDCHILTLSSSDHSSSSSSFCWAAQPGSWGPKPSVWRWLSLQQLRLELELNSACLELQLTQTVCGTWLYNCLTPTCFLGASHLHRIQPVHRSRWYSDIFDRMHLFPLFLCLFTQVHLLIDGPVEGQYVTDRHCSNTKQYMKLVVKRLTSNLMKWESPTAFGLVGFMAYQPL